MKISNALLHTISVSLALTTLATAQSIPGTPDSRERDMREIEAAISANKPELVVELIDNLVRVKPGYREMTTGKKVDALLKFSNVRALAFARAIFSDPRTSADVLNSVAWSLLKPPTTTKEQTGVALRCAAKASQKSMNENPLILDTLAAAQFRAGQVSDAVKTQSRAINLARRDMYDDETIKELNSRLIRYKPMPKKIGAKSTSKKG